MNLNFKQTLKQLWPHVAIIVSFVALSFLYFLPILEGKTLPQGDQTHAIGAAQELRDYEAETGKLAQWTNSMFGGMPAYQIKGDATHNIFRRFNAWTRIGLPYTTVAILFLYMLGFYALMLSMKMKKWIAFIGAIAFAFGSYNLIIIAAGHITKAYAIALMPVVIGGTMLIFSGKRFAGGALTMVGLGMELAYNHVQITYYLALALLVLVIVEAYRAVRKKAFADFGKNIATIVVAAILAVLPGTTNLWTTYEYGTYSIRGASELTPADGEKTSSGLDKDYALSWSYGIHETPTLLIPNIVGGVSEPIGYDLKAVQKLQNQQVRDAVANSVSKYWGGRAFTSGPVYLGAIVCFLFFIGCFYYKGREKWWLIAATIVSIFLAWGKNFAPLTDLMFYYFPLYNKFRTVEMALVIASVTVPILALLGLRELYENPELVRYDIKKFFIALCLTAGLALLFAMTPTWLYSFETQDEVAQFAQLKSQSALYAQLEQGIIDARIELARNDALRSAVLILLASSALWFYSVRKINANIAMGTIAILVIIDLWSVDKRYLGQDDFVPKSSNSAEFKMSTADAEILKDTEPHRVMALYKNPFNEVNTSYFHQSVGGYHGAKLRRYQDVIDRYLSNEWQLLVGALRKQDVESIDKLLSDATALNILNTKYLIYNPDAQPLYNPYALGAAWFVDDVKIVDTPDDAIKQLGINDLSHIAIIENADATSNPDSLSSIERTLYQPDRLQYTSLSTVDRVAVFSEIFYPAGWHAFIDGEETEILRADYILRALQIPSGRHEIEFRFEPKSYAVGKMISTIGSNIVLLVIIAAIVIEIRKKRKTTTE